MDCEPESFMSPENHEITSGVIEDLMSGKSIFQPKLQVMNVERMPEPFLHYKYNIFLSDGIGMCCFIAHPSLNRLCESGELIKKLIEITRHTYSTDPSTHPKLRTIIEKVEVLKSLSTFYNIKIPQKNKHKKEYKLRSKKLCIDQTQVLNKPIMVYQKKNCIKKTKNEHIVFPPPNAIDDLDLELEDNFKIDHITTQVDLYNHPPTELLDIQCTPRFVGKVDDEFRCHSQIHQQVEKSDTSLLNQQDGDSRSHVLGNITTDKVKCENRNFSPEENSTLFEENKLKEKCIPISALTEYTPKTWYVEMRVVYKSPIHKNYHRQQMKDSFFIDLIDHTSEIRCTIFYSVQEYYNLIEVNESYIFSKCLITTNNRKTIPNDYRLIIENSNTSIINLKNSNLPYYIFQFPSIANIKSKKIGDSMDAMGMILKSQISTGKSRKGDKFTRQDITLIDESDHKVTLNLWNDNILPIDEQTINLLAVRGAQVHEYNSLKVLKLVPWSQLCMNIEYEGAQRLRHWFSIEYPE